MEFPGKEDTIRHKKASVARGNAFALLHEDSDDDAPEDESEDSGVGRASTHDAAQASGVTVADGSNEGEVQASATGLCVAVKGTVMLGRTGLDLILVVERLVSHIPSNVHCSGPEDTTVFRLRGCAAPSLIGVKATTNTGSS